MDAVSTCGGDTVTFHLGFIRDTKSHVDSSLLILLSHMWQDDLLFHSSRN